MTDPLAVARSLIAMGVPVFVAKPDPGSSTGYRLPVAWQTMRASEVTLQGYRDGDALAAVCGHTFDVLDCDPRNGGDVTAPPFEMPEVLGQGITPSGGMHFWVRATGLGKCKAGEGWDFQAGAPDGSGRGFVFIAPTVRRSKANGEPLRYAWVEVPRVGTTPAPAAFLEHLQAQRLARPESADGWPVGPPEREGLGTPIPAGKHDATLSAYAAALLSRGLTDAEVRELVTLRIADCVGGDPSKPFTSRDVERWLSGARKFHRDPEPTLEPAEGTAAGFPVLDLAALWDAPVDEDWILRPLIAAGRGVALYSPPKVGKSLLALGLACAVATGAPFLGSPTRQGVVLYVDHENSPRGDTVKHLKNMGLTPDQLGDLRILSFPDMAPLDGAGGVQLLAEAQRHGASLVILDTVSRTIAGAENDNDTWLQFYRRTGRLLKDAGIAYLRLDHSGKDGDRGMRGASAKSSDVDMVWRLTGTASGRLELWCEATRLFLPEEEKVISMTREDGPLRHVAQKALSAADKCIVRGIVIHSILSELGPEKLAEMDLKEIRQLLTAKKVPWLAKAAGDGFMVPLGQQVDAVRMVLDRAAELPQHRAELVAEAQRYIAAGEAVGWAS